MSELAKKTFFDIEGEVKDKLREDERLTEISVDVEYKSVEVSDPKVEGGIAKKALPKFSVSYKLSLVNKGNEEDNNEA